MGSNIAIRQTHNQTILRRIVLVLVLEDQALASVVVGFSLTTPLEFNLIPLEVLLVFNNFDETLENFGNQ